MTDERYRVLDCTTYQLRHRQRYTQIDMLSALVDMITVTKRSLAFSFSHSLLRVRQGLGIMPHVVLLCEWEVVDSCSSLRLTLDFRAQRGGALEAGQPTTRFGIITALCRKDKRISRI